MKARATVSFRRTDVGEVIGEIISDTGEVLEARNFGKMSDEEINRVLEAFQHENPDTVILPIKLTDN